MAKKRYDAGKILTKVVAAVLAILMIFAAIGTLIFYLTIL